MDFAASSGHLFHHLFRWCHVAHSAIHLSLSVPKHVFWMSPGLSELIFYVWHTTHATHTTHTSKHSFHGAKWTWVLTVWLQFSSMFVCLFSKDICFLAWFFALTVSARDDLANAIVALRLLARLRFFFVYLSIGSLRWREWAWKWFTLTVSTHSCKWLIDWIVHPFHLLFHSVESMAHITKSSESKAVIWERVLVSSATEKTRATKWIWHREWILVKESLSP